MLHTAAFGSPHDPAVLLIMGAMASRIWRPEEFALGVKEPLDRPPSNHATLTDETDGSGRLSELTAPVLIIHGTEDRVYRQVMRLHVSIDGARLVTQEGSGHELHRADWPVILKALEEYTAVRR